MSPLIAYHNDPAIKSAILAQLQAHYDADEIAKGPCWKDGKGCAVGCTIHSGNHSEYETRFGIPLALAHFEDIIFEGLPNAEAQQWPLRFMGAIKPGQDLTLVHWKFLHWVLTDETINPGINHPLVKDAVAQCAEVMRGLAIGQHLNEEAGDHAGKEAVRAIYAALGGLATRAADSARVASAAVRVPGRTEKPEDKFFTGEYVEWVAAYQARRAKVEAIESVVEHTAWAARSGVSLEASLEATCAKMADKIIELIEAAS